jgi:hypothetical protein
MTAVFFHRRHYRDGNIYDVVDDEDIVGNHLAVEAYCEDHLHHLVLLVDDADSDNEDDADSGNEDDEKVDADDVNIVVVVVVVVDVDDDEHAKKKEEENQVLLVVLLVVDAVVMYVVEKDEEVHLDNDDIAAAAAVVPVPVAADKRRTMSPFQMMMVGSMDVEDVLDDVDKLGAVLEQLMQVAVVRQKWRMVLKSILIHLLLPVNLDLTCTIQYQIKITTMIILFCRLLPTTKLLLFENVYCICK